MLLILLALAAKSALRILYNSAEISEYIRRNTREISEFYLVYAYERCSDAKGSAVIFNLYLSRLVYGESLDVG
jgi:hypothetical protein